jgi:hypothetical protein
MKHHEFSESIGQKRSQYLPNILQLMDNQKTQETLLRGNTDFIKRNHGIEGTTS